MRYVLGASWVDSKNILQVLLVSFTAFIKKEPLLE